MWLTRLWWISATLWILPAGDWVYMHGYRTAQSKMFHHPQMNTFGAPRRLSALGKRAHLHRDKCFTMVLFSQKAEAITKKWNNFWLKKSSQLPSPHKTLAQQIYCNWSNRGFGFNKETVQYARLAEDGTGKPQVSGHCLETGLRGLKVGRSSFLGGFSLRVRYSCCFHLGSSKSNVFLITHRKICLTGICWDVSRSKTKAGAELKPLAETRSWQGMQRFAF